MHIRQFLKELTITEKAELPDRDSSFQSTKIGYLDKFRMPRQTLLIYHDWYRICDKSLIGIKLENCMKVTICVFIILIYNANLFSQKSKNRLGNQYSQGIDYYLSPGKNDSKREILFISKPSFNSPEYSVALEKKESSSILILRSFKSNYWELVFSKRSSPIDMVYSKIDSFVVYVSKGFEDKLKFYFQSVLRDSLISRIFDTYDGTTYQISDKKYFREVHDFEFSINKKYYQLIVICETLAYNLRKGDFDEKWYSDLIDKTLTPDEKNMITNQKYELYLIPYY